VNVLAAYSGTVSRNIFGGNSAVGDATDNDVIVNGGTVSYPIYGGYANGAGNATGNKVIVNGGTVSDPIFGGNVYGSGDATGNEVIITGGTVSGQILGGNSYSGDATGNHVTIGTDGGNYSSFTGGYNDGSGSGADLYTGNKLTVGGLTNTVGLINNFEFIEFALPAGVSDGDFMLSTGSITDVDITTVNVTAAPGFSIGGGESVTLLRSTASMAPFTPQPVTLNGVPYTVELNGTGDELVLTNNATDVTAPVPGAFSAATAVTTTSLDLNWTAATDDVSLPADLTYFVYQSDIDNLNSLSDCETYGTLLNSVTGGATSLSVSTLLAGTTYYFNIVVMDEAGNKALYTAISQVTASDVTPPTPGTFSPATAVTTTSLTLNWSAASDLVSAATALKYYIYQSGSNNLASVSDCSTNGALLNSGGTANIITFDVSGLTAGTTYYFNIVVEDEAGNPAAYTAISQATADNTPPTPGTFSTVTAVTTTSLTLNWSAASDLVSAPAALKYYIYQSGSNNLASVSDCSTNGILLNSGGTANIITFDVSGLMAGTTYYFNIVVEDEAGNSAAYTAISQATAALTTVNIATIAGVTPPVAGATAVTAITPTTQYTGTVSWSPAAGTFAAGIAYTATITLTPVTGYTLNGVAANFFTVAGTGSPATNAINDGVITAIFPATATLTVPGSPTGVTATAGDGQATVSFTAPASNGGSPVTGYTVTSNPGGITATGASGPITVTGLTNGTAYTFTVTATNSIGTSAPSAASNAVTPTASVTPPPPPPVTPTQRQVYLSSAPEGFTYDRPAGTYFVDSRGDFVFIIITTTIDDANGALKAAGHPLDNLKVTTGTARDTNGGVILERIATDSMRVTIKMVNENITITVTSGTPDGIKTVDGAKVWSYGGELHLYSPAAGEAWIYSLTGQLVKKLTYTAGETVTQPLARGVYIVKTEKKTWKVIVN
jgi:hypothetical protein